MRVAAVLLTVLGLHAPVAAHAGERLVSGASWWDAGVLLALLAIGAMYAAGSARLRARGARVRSGERAAFWAGWIAVVAAVAPPMDRAAAGLFSMHMAQHELLMLVGAPLMVVGRPLVPWLWSLPAALRPVAGSALQSGGVSGAWRLLTWPAAAWAVHGATVWVWHMPALYEAAVRSEAIHAVQHATFVGTAVLFWWGLVYGRYGRAAYGASALYVFVTTVHTGVLGALFSLSSAPFYPWYADRAVQTGIDAVADQQLAGLYMWIPAGVVLTVFGLALMVAWLSEADRRARATSPARGTGGTRATTAKATLVIALLSWGAACGSLPHERSARQLTGGDPYRGRQLIPHYGCDSCHTIPGVPTADATVGPPLTGVARRVYLAGHIENTPENMIEWIQHPHAFEPQTAMPEMGVTSMDSRDITAYLYTLR